MCSGSGKEEKIWELRERKSCNIIWSSIINRIVRKHIHLSYFMMDPRINGDPFLDLLEGVAPAAQEQRQDGV